MGAPRRINRQAARLHWLAQDDPRSFGATARSFGVSQRAIAALAKRDGWVAEAEEMDAKAVAKAKAKLDRSQGDRYADVLRLADLSVLLTLAGLEDGSLDLKANDAAGYVKLAMALDGKATSIIEVGQVRDVLAAWNAAIMPFVPIEDRPAAVAAVRAATSQLRLEPGDAAA